MHRSIIVAIAALALAACGQVSTVEEAAPFEEEPAAIAPGAEFCEEVERAVTPEECAILNELARRVQPGWGSFKAPETMTRGETELVVLAVSRRPYVPPPDPFDELAIVHEAWSILRTAQSEGIDTANSESFAPVERALAIRDPVQLEAALPEARNAISRLAHAAPPPSPPPAAAQPAPGAGPAEQEPDPAAAPEPAAPVTEEETASETVPEVEDGRGVDDQEVAPEEVVVGEEPEAPAQTPRDMVETVPGVLSEFEPMTGRFMRANLNADQGFEITALSPAAQEVTEDGVTTWRWRVRATEDGARQLELETVVEGCLDDARARCYLLESTRYQHPVSVSVGWWGKFLDWLKELPDILKIITAAVVALTSLVAAIFGLRAAFRKGNGADKTPDAEPPTAET
jgi:hypothetical protein